MVEAVALDRRGRQRAALRRAMALLILVLSFSFSTIFPAGDDVALIGASRRFAPGERFLCGFYDYFNAYIAWTPPSTNFIRPVVNLIFWFGCTLLAISLGFNSFGVKLLGVHVRQGGYCRARIAGHGILVELLYASIIFLGAPFCVVR
jgi:hypothetical protein